jgi:hypothetical protein
MLRNTTVIGAIGVCVVTSVIIVLDVSKENDAFHFGVGRALVGDGSKNENCLNRDQDNVTPVDILHELAWYVEPSPYVGRWYGEPSPYVYFWYVEPSPYVGSWYVEK